MESAAQIDKAPLCRVVVGLLVEVVVAATEKTSIKFGPREMAAGAPSRLPPSRSYALHSMPSHDLWYSALSLPLTKTSSRFGAQEDAVGTRRQDSAKGDVVHPPSVPGLVPKLVVGTANEDVEPIRASPPLRARL